MKSPCVLVTGATGFVGRHLCRELVKRGWNIRATWVHAAPTFGIRDPAIEWRQVAPLGPDTEWAPLLEGTDVVIHLAALAHRVGSRAPVAAVSYDIANHLGTARLAAQVRAARTVRRFIFVSSIGAVASLAKERLDEGSPCRPDTPYGRSKLAAEGAVRCLAVRDDLSWTILRPPLMYGEGNPGNMERLLRLIRLPIPLPFASVRNRRSFLYVGNLVDAMLTTLDHRAAANRLFCLSDMEELSTPDLMRCLGEAAHRKVRLIPCPVSLLRILALGGDLAASTTRSPFPFDRATLEKLCGSLAVSHAAFEAACGWKPPFRLAEGLRATLRPSAPVV